MPTRQELLAAMLQQPNVTTGTARDMAFRIGRDSSRAQPVSGPTGASVDRNQMMAQILSTPVETPRTRPGEIAPVDATMLSSLANIGTSIWGARRQKKADAESRELLARELAMAKGEDPLASPLQPIVPPSVRGIEPREGPGAEEAAGAARAGIQPFVGAAQATAAEEAPRRAEHDLAALLDPRASTFAAQRMFKPPPLETIEGPDGSWLQRDPATGELKPVLGREAAPSTDLVAIMGPDGKPQYVRKPEAVGQEPFRPASNTMPGSLQELEAINEERRAIGQEPLSAEDYLSQRRSTSADMQSYAQYLKEQSENPTSNVLPMDEFLAQTRGNIAGAEQRGKTTEQRWASQIDEGFAAADSLPVIRRGLELLKGVGVETGGFEALKLWANNRLGITGADEGELSANLGKAVLSQLRSTFGAQFTEREGARLAELEAGFGKSTAVNTRLLEQAYQLVERTARRGVNAARNIGDAETVRLLEEAMSMQLDFSEEAPATAATGASDPLSALTPEQRKKYGLE